MLIKTQHNYHICTLDHYGVTRWLILTTYITPNLDTADMEPEEKESAYLQQMYKSLLTPGAAVSLGSVHQSHSTVSALTQSQATLAALNRIQQRTEPEKQIRSVRIAK